MRSFFHIPVTFLIALQLERCCSFLSWSLPTHSHVSRSQTHQTSAVDDGISISKQPISEHLQHLVASGDNETILTVDGYVLAKRSFGSSLVFVDFLLDANNSHQDAASSDICQALLRREYYQGSYYDGHRKSLFPGTRFEITGRAAPTRNPGEAVLLIQQLTMQQVPRQPQHLAAILKLAMEQALPLDHVDRACGGPCLSEWANETATPSNAKLWARQILDRLQPLDAHVQAMIRRHSEVKSVSNRGRRPSSPSKWSQIPANVTTALKGSVDRTGRDVTRLNSVQETLELDFVTFQSASVQISGWVQNRRRFDPNITILFLVDQMNSSSVTASESDGSHKDLDNVFQVDHDRLEIVLHPNLLGPAQADMYGNLLAIGSQVSVQGIVQTRSGSSPQLWATVLRLQRASWRPNTVRYAVDLIFEGRLSVEEGAEALGIPTLESETITVLDDVTERKWKATELSVRLQQRSDSPRISRLAPELLKVLETYEEQLLPSWPATQIDLQHIDDEGENTEMNRKTLKESLPGSKWRQKKRPQLDWMVQQIEKVARAHSVFGTRTLDIVDIGGGKGNLANYLAERLGGTVNGSGESVSMPLVQVHVVDIAKRAIANGMMRARRLDLNVNYRVEDASRVQFLDHGVDIVVALHACGHLTDIAMAHAMQQDASFVLCPCCFSSNPMLRIPNTDETVHDFLGLPQVDWSALKLAAEVQDDAPLAARGIHAICAVRAQAAAQKATGIPYSSIEITSFPIQWSTRNMCLVGTIGSSNEVIEK